MVSFFRRLFSRSSGSSTARADDDFFAARFHRFRLFLSASIEAYSEMLDFEERLAGEMPFGMPFLRMCAAKLTVSAMQCVMQLNALGGGRFERLYPPFAHLRGRVQASLERGVTPLSGPMIVPYAEVGEEHERLISPSLTKLRAIRLEHPEFMPRGLVVTGAAWWAYFNNPDMHDEIDRLMLISHDDPGSYSEAGAAIRERMAKSFPLPEALEDELREALDVHLPELGAPNHGLLLRSMPVLPEHAALVMPEQLLRTPADTESVVLAIAASLSMAYRARSMIFRLKRGIRDRAMPLCVSLTLIPEVHARGSAHRRLCHLDSDELHVRVRRGFVTPDLWPLQASVEGAVLPSPLQAVVEANAGLALDCLKDAPVRGNRHELFWVVSEDGRFYVLGVNALPNPALAGGAAFAGENCLAGGMCTYPGEAVGRARLVRNFTDALAFPIGDILVLQRASPRWSFLLDFARAAVAGDGTGNGLFARTARRYGRPVILRKPEAFERLENETLIRLVADSRRDSLICPEDGSCGTAAKHSGGKEAAQTDGVPGAAWPLAVEGGHDAAPLWLPHSDIAAIARELAQEVVPLTLPDSDSVDFRAENCRTFRDFLNYCHVHAVREMFRAGTSVKSAQAPAKQLVSDVPTQFWIINLDDGFYEAVKGPVVGLDQIASIPMRSLWEGFVDKPWEGPPAINARGFLSVLFEATVNPNLDPASQSTTYTEKNVFMVARRFCSMRCRFGFHFLALDSFLSEREGERFIIFQFKGGAANLNRRIRRVHFVAEMLAGFDFATEITGDTLTARLEGGDERRFLAALRVLGYLTMHTRQLDMIMGDEEALAAYRFQMLEDMFALAGREPLVLP